MKKNYKKIFVVVSSLGVVAVPSFVLTSCSTKEYDNPYSQTVNLVTNLDTFKPTSMSELQETAYVFRSTTYNSFSNISYDLFVQQFGFNLIDDSSSSNTYTGSINSVQFSNMMAQSDTQSFTSSGLLGRYLFKNKINTNAMNNVNLSSTINVFTDSSKSSIYSVNVIFRLKTGAYWKNTTNNYPMLFSFY